MGRLRRLVASGATLCVVLVATAVPASASSPVATDFGHDGRVATVGNQSLSYGESRTQAAVAGNGDVYVAARTGSDESIQLQLRRYLPDGRLDPSFGQGGAVVVQQVAGMKFEFATLLVDTSGLPYLVGTTFDPHTAFVGPYLLGPLRGSYATVLRFTTSGALDPTYGDDGFARFNFGLPVPEPDYEAPPVYGLRGAIDQQDRVLLVVAEEGSEAGGSFDAAFYENARVVARLGPSGRLDGTFGEGGTTPIPDGPIDGLGVDEEGRAQVLLPPAEPGGRSFRLLRLRPDGQPAAGFAAGGIRRFTGVGFARALAVEPDGASLVLGTIPGPRPKNGGTITPVMKVGSRRGRPAGFGDHGVARVHLPGHSFIGEIVADGRGGAYLVGALVTRRPGVRTWGEPRRQGLIVHLEADGKLDPNFGRHGRLVISGPNEIIAKGAQKTAGGRRLLAWGLSQPPGNFESHQFLAEYHLEAPVIFYGFGPGELP